MSTVFEVAGITFTKDLVFGWCVNVNDEWVMLNDLNDKSLQLIHYLNFPVYVPEDFKREVFAIINHRNDEKLQKVNQPVIKTVDEEKKKDEKPFETTSIRHEDRIALMTDIFENTVYDHDMGAIVIQLPYVKIIQQSNKLWVIAWSNGVDKNALNHHHFKNITEICDFILKRWW